MHICGWHVIAEKWREKRIALSEEISELAFGIQIVCVEYGLQAWLATTEEIRVLAFGLQTICSKYGAETWLKTSDAMRV